MVSVVNVTACVCTKNYNLSRSPYLPFFLFLGHRIAFVSIPDSFLNFSWLKIELSKQFAYMLTFSCQVPLPFISATLNLFGSDPQLLIDRGI